MLLRGYWRPILTGVIIIRAAQASPIEIIKNNPATSVPEVTTLPNRPSPKSFTSAAADFVSSYQLALQPESIITSTMKYLLSLIVMALASTSVPAVEAHPGAHPPHYHEGETRNADLVAKLRMAASMKDRAALLPNNDDWKFDFAQQADYSYSPGSVISANVASFPAAVGHGLTVAMLSLGPCAMLPPHYHPRAANWVTAVEGTTKTWMIQENGVKPIEVVLEPHQMTIFPAGSLHTMQNMGMYSSCSFDPSASTGR